MIKRISYIICLLLSTFYAEGKIHNGRIINEQGSPMRGVVVINMTRASADYTNDEGYFTIQADYGDTLLIYEDYCEEMKCVFTESNKDITFSKRYSFKPYPQITDDKIKLIHKLYYAGKYKDCIAYCMYYLGGWCTNIHGAVQLKNHPYQDWGINGMYRLHTASTPLKYAELCYIGSISAFVYIDSAEFDMLVNGLEWSMSCVAIIDDYLQVSKPTNRWSADKMYDYIILGKMGMDASEKCRKFIKSLSKELKWNHNERWLEKKSDRILEVLYKNTNGYESLFSDKPLLRYEISKIGIDYVMKKGNYSQILANYENHKTNSLKLILQRGKNDAAGFDAINYLSSLLKKIIMDEKIRENSKSDFIRYCMEQLIKLQDISYFLNGSSVYSLKYNYSLEDIQKCLGENDCAIIMFEERTNDEVLDAFFHAFLGLGSPFVFKDYALIITKNQENPDFLELPLSRLLEDVSLEYIKCIKSKCPRAKRLFLVGTPRMSSAVDVAGKDSSIVRLHSLSQIFRHKDKVLTNKEVTFIGDIDYGKVHMPSASNSTNLKGNNEEEEKFDRLSGPAEELKQIKLLFNNVRPVCGDSATRSIVMNEISRSKGVVHISTHGYINSNFDEEISYKDLIIKKNFLDNSYLILSGYNDDPGSPMTCLSGSDVLEMEKIDSYVVFLDACLSGKGSVGVAGSVGIAEAFHMIGAKNVICYLEPVDDDIATDFSNRFYIELSKGASCHNAFFRAKNSMNMDLKVVLWE